MPEPDELLAVLHEWTGLFMRNSMHNFLAYARKKGVSMPQIGALFRIRRRRDCSVSDISAELGITNAAASQMLETLVHLGLVSRTENPQDRRVRQIELTEKGRRMLKESIRSRQQWLRRLADLLTEPERTHIASALNILIDKSALLEEGNPAGESAPARSERERTPPRTTKQAPPRKE
jgi:DNA-binding MarR family transcriptional regulator